MSHQPPTTYERLVGLIGAPEVTIDVGLVELETIRGLLDRCPRDATGDHGWTAEGWTPRNERAEALMRELDHRAGAALAAADAAHDEARVPITTGELALIREVLGEIDHAPYMTGKHDVRPAETALLIALDRRRGATQYRATKPDPGE